MHAFNMKGLAMTLLKEMDAYGRMRAFLETDHLGKWALVCGGELIGIHDEFHDAADDAHKRYGKGPYLVRKIGEGPMTLPASILYRPTTA